MKAREAEDRSIQKVLVVDDNPDAAHSLCQLLRLRGWEADCSMNGNDALRAVCELRPAGIVLDLLMPTMDGFELTRRLRSLPETAQARIVVLTGSAQHRQRALDAGADRVLLKPADLEQIEEALLR